MNQKHVKDIAASVRQRLLNLSHERGEDFQLTLIYYALERLMYRLSRSPHREQFVLKGAMLFLFGARIPTVRHETLTCWVETRIRSQH